ncbi:MAG TPA: peptidylprolyl isomerase [Ignavibacteriaceae bacterium]|nr:peptidylprolyl isomerase [Ignavibacteriaceae bacterium]
MRSLAPAFIITVGAIFVLFMIVSDSNLFQALGNRGNNLGSVNGDEITVAEFNNMYNQQAELQKRQTGKDMDDEQAEQFREQIWDALVTQKLIDQQMKKYNIVVTDQEVEETIFGENPPDFLKQYFIDSLGNFNRQLYDQALRSPNNKAALTQAKDLVRQQKLNEKLQSMLFASVNFNEDEVKKAFEEQSKNYNVMFALADINLIPDNQIKVSDDELKDYYNNHQDKYQVKAQRKLKYVLFTNSASPEDSQSVLKGLTEVKDLMQGDTATFKSFVETYSSEPYSMDTLDLSSIPETARDLLSNAQVGSVVGPVATPGGYTLYKVNGVFQSGQPMARASHILISNTGDDAKTLEEANKIYEQLKAGANFQELAKIKSQDPGSAKNGGDLGWFGKGAMVPEFENAVFNGKIGEVQKPVKTNFGYHIIKVTGRSNNKFIVEKIVNPIKASASTKENASNNAKDFYYIADRDGFETAAKTMNIQVQETPPFLKDANNVPGLGSNRKIIDFAFDEDLNDISDPLKTMNGYTVAKISEVVNEGVEPFEKVKDLLKNQVIRDKKLEKVKAIAQDVYKKSNGDMSKITGINSNVKVDTTGKFNFAGHNIPKIGRDYALMDKINSLELNKVSEPIKGLRGYYIIKVLERDAFNKQQYEAARNTLRQNMIQEKRNFFFQQWLEKLKKDAKIVDNRQ